MTLFRGLCPHKPIYNHTHLKVCGDTDIGNEYETKQQTAKVTTLAPFVCEYFKRIRFLKPYTFWREYGKFPHKPIYNHTHLKVCGDTDRVKEVAET